MSRITVMRIGSSILVIDNVRKIEPASDSSIRVFYDYALVGGVPQLSSEVIQGCSIEQFWAAMQQSPVRSVEAQTDA